MDSKDKKKKPGSLKMKNFFNRPSVRNFDEPSTSPSNSTQISEKSIDPNAPPPLSYTSSPELIINDDSNNSTSSTSSASSQIIRSRSSSSSSRASSGNGSYRNSWSLTKGNQQKRLDFGGIQMKERLKMSQKVVFELPTFSPEMKAKLDMISEEKILLRIPSSLWPHERKFRMDLEKMQIVWRGGWKSSEKAFVNIQDIVEVRVGTKTDKYANVRVDNLDHLSFSVIHSGNNETLDIVCETTEVRNTWAECVRYLMEQSRIHRWETNFGLLLKQIFARTDKNSDGQVNFDEFCDLLRVLNISVDKKSAKKDFEQMDVDKNGYLDVGEFSRFYQCLKFRNDIQDLFLGLSEPPFSHITKERFREFVEKTQKEVFQSDEEFENFIAPYFTPEGLTPEGFQRYLESSQNNAFEVERRKEFQDMNQPLSHYFINSSHNTYLEAHQLHGNSSVECYKRSLRLGCRCVELDCWDGANNEPIIYHGFTLTSKILFREVIEAIKDYAFITSEYPVILSFENHCSVPQQVIMANILKEILGDILCSEPLPENDGSVKLPSPTQLKRKVLIKGKVLDPNISSQSKPSISLGSFRRTNSNGQINVNSLASNNTAAEKNSTPSTPTVAHRPPSPNAMTAKENSGNTNNQNGNSLAPPKETYGKQAPASKENEEKQAPASKDNQAVSFLEEEEDEEDALPAQYRTEMENPEKQSVKKIAVAPELSELAIYCKAARFKSFEHAQSSFKANMICSFGEKKSEKLIMTQPKEYIEFNRTILSRIYPAGSRVDSSNYDPIPHWTHGCQVVALNFQTLDTPWELNFGKFQENGKTGYVLKPKHLLDEKYKPEKGLLKIRVISGQQLPKPRDSRKRMVVNPHVEIEVHSYSTEKKRQYGKTKTIIENGFNPIWNEEFEFRVEDCDLALLRFVVMDRDLDGDDMLASNVIPFRCLAMGYRHVGVYDCNRNLVKLGGIFIYSEFEPEINK